MSVKVSIIVTAHNYGDYLKECLDSALNQTYSDYEVVVVDDGSTDETPEILKSYESEYPNRLRTVRLNGEGLPAASNAGIRVADGEYVVRLDADDYFDENLVTVEAEFLDDNPSIDLVYPDYYTISEDGEIIDHVRNMRVNDEVKLLNRSPLAAGAMYRKSAWKAIGGYNESLDYQEDYDFWIRFINEYTVRNVNLPLMYYRQHGDNMSNNLSGRLSARRDVKSEFVNENLSSTVDDIEVLGIIPARAETRFEAPPSSQKNLSYPLALHKVAGHPLLEYTVKEALAADRLDRVIVSTEDAEIAENARKSGAEVPWLRDEKLADRDILLGDLMKYSLDRLATNDSYEPDFVVLLQYVSPLKTADIIDEVVNTWMMFSVDSVITVTKNDNFHWQPGTFGLDPLFDERLLREEREILYEENGSIYGFTPEVVYEQGDIIGENVGHVEMQQQQSIHIDSWFDLQMCEMILQNENGLVPEYRNDFLAVDR
jgi:CMP-N-acetylneuraminic acid synthetase